MSTLQLVRLVLRPRAALFLQVMIDRTCQGRDVTGERTGAAWSSTSFVIKVKVSGCYGAGKSLGRILSWLYVRTLEPTTWVQSWC